MAKLIPVGTICIVVGIYAKPEHLGAFCTVVGYVTKPLDPDKYVVEFADLRTNPFNDTKWTAAEGCLHPLYPPKPQALTRKDKDVPVTA